MSKVTKEKIDKLVEAIKVETFETMSPHRRIILKGFAILPKPILPYLIEVVDEEVSDNTIQQSPASFLLKIVDLLPKKYRQDLQQNISDMRLEYYEALAEKKIWRARFIVAFYHIGISWSVLMWIPDKVKRVFKTTPKKD